MLFARPALLVGVFVLLLVYTMCRVGKRDTYNSLVVLKRIALPNPLKKSSVSIEEAMQNRRSHRNFKDEPLTMQDLSQLLWAAQGITGNDGKRTAPSAGALYPLEIYVASGNVTSLQPGIYHYQPSGNMLEQLSEGDKRQALMFAALMQGSLSKSAAVLIIAANFNRTTHKYGERGKRFVYMEAGHAAENICLQAVPLSIGVVTVGAFSDSSVKRIIGLPAAEMPIYLIPVGKL